MRRDIPIEAVSIDGSFVEDLLPGYKTVKTSGREALSTSLKTIKVGSADGETYMGSNYPAREIKVDFFLKVDSLPDLRTKLNQLNNILSAEERDFVFNDEEDKYFTGVPYLESDVVDSQDACQGTYVIYCAYPFKRSVNVYEAVPTSLQDNTASFTINYNGTYPSKPLLVAEFAGAMSGGTSSDDGDCGFIAFVDNEENIIQLGNPEAVDFTEYEVADMLVNKQFVNTTDFTVNGGSTFDNQNVTGSVSCANITDTYYNKGAGQSISFAKPTWSAVTTGWHGPTLRKTITPSKYFTLSAVPKMAKSDNAETGTLEISAYAGSTVVAGIEIVKDKSGVNGTVKYLIDGEVRQQETIDLSYYNTSFGYCKRTQLYKTQYYNKKKKKWQATKIKGAKTRKVTNGYSYTSTNPNVTITKGAGSVTFTVGNLGKKVFPTETETEANSVVIHFGRFKTSAPLNTNAIHSVKLVANPTGVFRDIQNVFTAGDIVEADCYDGSVTLRQSGTEEGRLAPEYGALGNNWEGFSLTKGQNLISAVWSDWVSPTYKPTVKILYNEVFL